MKEGKTRFDTTRWSIVCMAQDKDASACDAALEDLCQSYWYPLYAYVRRRGYSMEEAQDLTQEFFFRLTSKDYIRSADREKGKFRTFLLVAIKHFLANEWHRANAQKRGGGNVLGESALHVDGDVSEGPGINEIIGKEPTAEFANDVSGECDALLELLPEEDMRKLALLKMEGHNNK